MFYYELLVKNGNMAGTIAGVIYEIWMVNERPTLLLAGVPGFEWPEGWMVKPAELN